MRNLTMMNHKNLNSSINTYFALKDKDTEPYTVPGLALAAGFSRSGDILSTLKEAEDGESPYPEQAITLLTRAVTRIEEHCLVNGLKGKFPPALAKFCLGSYHNVRDTNEQQQLGVTQLAIVFSDGQSDPTTTIKNITHNSQPTIQPMPPLSISFSDSLLAAL